MLVILGKFPFNKSLTPTEVPHVTWVPMFSLQPLDPSVVTYPVGYQMTQPIHSHKSLVISSRKAHFFRDFPIFRRAFRAPARIVGVEVAAAPPLTAGEGEAPAEPPSALADGCSDGPRCPGSRLGRSLALPRRVR